MSIEKARIYLEKGIQQGKNLEATNQESIRKIELALEELEAEPEPTEFEEGFWKRLSTRAIRKNKKLHEKINHLTEEKNKQEVLSTFYLEGLEKDGEEIDRLTAENRKLREEAEIQSQNTFAELRAELKTKDKAIVYLAKNQYALYHYWKQGSPNEKDKVVLDKIESIIKQALKGED